MPEVFHMIIVRWHLDYNNPKVPLGWAKVVKSQDYQWLDCFLGPDLGCSLELLLLTSAFNLSLSKHNTYVLGGSIKRKKAFLTRSLGRCCKAFYVLASDTTMNHLYSILLFKSESHDQIEVNSNWLPEGINAWMVDSFAVPVLLLLLIHSVVSESLWPLDCSIPGFSVFHYLPEFAQSHVHWVSDGIQPSHPPLSTSPLAFNLPQHQGSFPISWLFTSGTQSIVASVSASILPVNI